MKNGTRVIKRTNARNYIQESSQKRLDETVKPFNKQVLNALSVDYVQCMYYNAIHTGHLCSCEQQEPGTEESYTKFDGNSFEIGKTTNSKSFAENGNYEVVSADELNSMFGDRNANIDSVDDYDLSDEFNPVDERVEIFKGPDALFAGHNTNCGVCYRTGYVPSHSLQRGMRFVFTYHDVENFSGYSLNKSDVPYSFEKLTSDGFVEFKVLVPKYYAKASFTIRNNNDILIDRLYKNSSIITDSVLRTNAGKEITFRVLARNFTHISIEFTLNADPLYVNVAAINRTLDYTMLETMGNLQVILPPNIGNVAAGDCIALPSRNLVLKVVDISPQQTSKMKQLEYQVNCRVLQPQETLRKMSFNRAFD